MDLWMRNTQKQINNQPIYRLSKHAFFSSATNPERTGRISVP